MPFFLRGMNNFELFSENNLTKRTEKNTKRNFGVSVKKPECFVRCTRRIFSFTRD